MKKAYALSLDAQVHSKIWSGENNVIVKTSKDLPLYVLQDYLCNPGSSYTMAKVKRGEYIITKHHELKNQEVIAHLKPLSPIGLKLIAINQCANKALFKNGRNDLIVYKYDSRPTKLDREFYFVGSTTDTANEISMLFNYC
jgi:hypothetical protein